MEGKMGCRGPGADFCRLCIVVGLGSLGQNKSAKLQGTWEYEKAVISLK